MPSTRPRPRPNHPAPARPVTPARRVAFAVLRRVDEGGAWADRALEAEAARARLAPRERALATRLVFGAVQHQGTLDWLIERLAGRSPGTLDAPTRAALRLGLEQIVHLDAIAPHAAVGEAVELAKHANSGGHRLVNAVLRRAVREARALLAGLREATPEEAALRHSHPAWIARRWWDTHGPGTAVALMAAANRPAEAAVRANTLVLTPAELRRALRARGVRARPAPGEPDGLVLEDPFDAHGSDLWRTGALIPQSRASMRVAHAVDPHPGEAVLDLCAAPGAKTTHLAALMRGQGRIVSVERHEGRAGALRSTARRMHAGLVRVDVDDATRPRPDGFHRVLVDPPCSGLGTLSQRPDLRWRITPERIPALAALQQRILAAGAAAVRPGGTLVYSTCTILPEENEQVVAAFLDDHPEFALDPLGNDHSLWHHAAMPGSLQSLPSRDGTSGFFIARLRRTGPAR